MSPVVPHGPTPEEWVEHEDAVCREGRVLRLRWLVSVTPREGIWSFPGAALSVHLFEEARYCFVYGQFLAAIALGMAYAERTLADWFYASGRNDLKRASFTGLLREARGAGWLDAEEYADLERIRKLRNPVMHFRSWGRADKVERRALEQSTGLYELFEDDARHVLAAVMQMLSRNAS